MAHLHNAADWAEAVQYYRTWPSSGIAQLIERIAASRYVDGIWGWTSVSDLCIAQPPVHEPMSASYLRISALGDGTIKFVYLDTTTASRMWTRTVPQDQAFARLESFFAQLRWFGGPE